MSNDRKYPNRPTARKGSPDTAFEASDDVADAAKSRERVALAFIRSLGLAGATADEVSEHFEWERYSSRPRLSTLKARSLIVDSGDRRKGVSGKSQSVLIAVEFANLADDPQLSLPVAA